MHNHSFWIPANKTNCLNYTNHHIPSAHRTTLSRCPPARIMHCTSELGGGQSVNCTPTPSDSRPVWCWWVWDTKTPAGLHGEWFTKALLLICLKRSCKVRISPRQRSPDARSRAVPYFLHALSDVKFSLDRIVIRSLFGHWMLKGGNWVLSKCRSTTSRITTNITWRNWSGVE